MDLSVVIEAFKQYGLAATLLGILTIFLTGVVKLVFKKRLDTLSKETRKALYEGVCIAFAALSALVYFSITRGGGADLYWQEAAATYAVAKILYPLYENFRLRDLLKYLTGQVKAKIDKEGKQDG